MDKPTKPDDFYDFANPGLGEPIPISAANMLNLGDLLDEIVQKLSAERNEEEDQIKIAVIEAQCGQIFPINELLGEARVIVAYCRNNQRFPSIRLLNRTGKIPVIDTAGIHRKSKVNEDIERLA